MFVSGYGGERAAEFHRQDLLSEAERERQAREVGRQTVREGRERRRRLDARRPLGHLLVRLGTRLAGNAAARPVPVTQQGSVG